MLRSTFTLLTFILLSSVYAEASFFYDSMEESENTKTEYVELRSRHVTINQNFILALPDETDMQFELFEGCSVNILLQKESRAHYLGMTVWKGSTDEVLSYPEHYRNTVIVYNPHSGKLTGMIEAYGSNYVFLPVMGDEKHSENDVYRLIEYEVDIAGCSVMSGSSSMSSYIMNSSSCGYCNERDLNGDAVLDMYIGFSNSAATYAGDINAYALMVVQDVNMGLANSMISGVYMRLVGTGVTSNNPGVVTSVLSDAWTWFAADIEATSADFISVFQTFTNAPNEAGGWAGVPGRSSVNGVALPAAFRHEVGHNVGAGHCPGDGSVLPYAHGYNNGNWTTHMCGNATNFYSNPDITDNLGNPIGDAATADMARVWEERASLISGHAIHSIPYYAGDETVDADGDDICGSIDCDDTDAAVTFGCASGNYSALVQNVDTVHTGGAPGSLYLTSISSIPIASNPFATDCPSLFIAGGMFGAGRFIAVGHDGILSDGSVNNFDNPTFLKNAFNWLNNDGNKNVRMTSGHSEWINFNNTTALQNLILQEGFQTLELAGTITPASLIGVDVLVVGNAWGTVSASEIAAIHNFVTNGGAVFMVGLGWSYESFSGPLADFPMNQIGSPMGVEWISGTINDPVNQFNGSPLFRYFYPYISMRSPCNIAVDAICVESEVFIHQVDDPLYQSEDILYSDAYVPCDAIFRSSQYIELVSGFEVPMDVNFIAELEECP